MANRNDDNRRDNDTVGGQLAALGRELAGAIAGFAFQLSKIFVKGGFGLYRTLNQPGTQHDPQPEQKTTPESQPQSRSNSLAGLFGQREAAAPTESPAAVEEDAASLPQPKQPTQRSGKFTYVDDADDPEAAALLDDLLQETAQRIQSDPAPDEASSVTADPAPPADADASETAAPPEPRPITYDTPDEKARIQEQLRQREERLKQEAEIRKEVFEQKATQQASLQDAMKADIERIKREREEREARFRQAEAERKRREEAPEQNARLSDDGSEDDTASDAAGDNQGQLSSEG